MAAAADRLTALAVLIAARTPLEPLLHPCVLWPERYLALKTKAATRVLEIHTVHAPLSQRPVLPRARGQALHRGVAVGLDSVMSEPWE